VDVEEEEGKREGERGLRSLFVLVVVCFFMVMCNVLTRRNNSADVVVDGGTIFS
jgi:hypothetical protein